jgi:hypothetical protein
MTYRGHLMVILISIINDHTFYKLTSIKLAKYKIKISSMFHYIKKQTKRKMKKGEFDDVFGYELDDENWRPTYILP